MKGRILFIVLPALLISGACSKDPLTKPSNVSFTFVMNGFDMSDDKSETIAFTSGINNPGVPGASNNHFIIDHGTLSISSIEFEGRREQGQDVFFESDLGQAIVANLSDGTTNVPVRFDIPQGVYNHLEVVLNLGENEQAPLVLHGRLTKGPMQDYPVRFEYRFTERVRIKGRGQQNQQIVLQADRQSVARVELQAENLFRLINMGMIMNASIVNEGGQEIILIDNTNNLPIFNMIANRLSNSFSLIID
jgi:hypothetical protein